MVPTEAWIERAARLHPERVAVASPEATLTYAELERASWRVGQQLAAAEPAPGARIALWQSPGSPPADPAVLAIALHACLRQGLVAVPIDPRLPDPVQAERLAASDDALALPSLPPLAELTATLAGGEELGRGLSSMPGVAGRAPRMDPDAQPRRPIAGSGDDAHTPAVLLYTSGSTGPGTPVLLSRGNLLWNAIGSAAALGQPAHERWLSAMPTAHVGGLTVLTRSAIAATTAVLRPRFDAAEQTALLMGGAATITSVVPTMLSRMLDLGLSTPPNLRLVLLGGGPIPAALVERAAAAGVPVAATYGMTEATSQIFTAGAPLFCTRVALRGSVAEASEAPGTGLADPSEILVQGPTVAASAAPRGGWLATGDRGAVDHAGRFRVVGRLAETIITGGENVAPSEVEAALLALPGIAEAAVLGVRDPEWGERVEARVVLDPGAALDERALQEALRQQLPPFAVPKRIVAVPQLPRTETGKVRRAELR